MVGLGALQHSSIATTTDRTVPSGEGLFSRAAKREKEEKMAWSLVAGRERNGTVRYF